MQNKNAENSSVGSQLIPPEYINSPMFRSQHLSELLQREIYLKDETRNPIGSFKARGAFHYCAKNLVPHSTVVCASAGNFGQGMAVATAQYQSKLIVFAAKSANPIKVKRMQELGAEVRLEGTDFDAAKELAREHAFSIGAQFVEDGAEDSITEGASTLGTEIFCELQNINSIFVPVGNGALVCGIARAKKRLSPSTQIIGVTAKGAPAMRQSFLEKQLICAAGHTIADGIAVRSPVPQIMNEFYESVDSIIEVSEEEIRLAMKIIYEAEGIVTEPAGVIGVAGVLAANQAQLGKRTVIPLCGANVDPILWRTINGC